MTADWERLAEEFQERYFTVLVEGIDNLLAEMKVRVHNYIGPSEELPSSRLLLRLDIQPITIDGRTFDAFWLSGLKVDSWTSSTMRVETELVLGSGELFADVSLFAGVSGRSALSIASTLRHSARR